MRRAITRRNVLAHGSLEVRNAGDYEADLGQLEWSEGKVLLKDEECGDDVMAKGPCQRRPRNRGSDPAARPPLRIDSREAVTHIR